MSIQEEKKEMWCLGLQHNKNIKIIWNIIMKKLKNLKDNNLYFKRVMNNRIKNSIEEIKYSYTALQMSIYLEYFIKTDYKVNNNIGKLLNWPEYDINLWKEKRYILRKDYIQYWIDTSLLKTLNWGIMWDMSIINSFTNITLKFSELLDNEELFSSYVKDLFREKNYIYEDFYSIIRLIRNISTHGSISHTYTLKLKDFEIWKKNLIKKWKKKLQLNLNIIDNLHRLDLSINIEEIQEWYNFSEIFGVYEMLMFIELCMNLSISYMNKNNI